MAQAKKTARTETSEPAQTQPSVRPRLTGGAISDPPAYLVFDIETIPDGELIRRIHYPEERMSAEKAIERFQAEQFERTGKVQMVPLSYAMPIAVCVMRVSADFLPTAITCLDVPKYRPKMIVRDFWHGMSLYKSILVSFNGRAFDLPVLELGAFRYGIAAGGHFTERFGRRYRFSTAHIDLYEWLTNHGAYQLAGGLKLLSKLLGKPSRVVTSGKDVWPMYQAKQIEQINHYCMHDVLDTYFVFLRTRVMCGEIDLKTEQARVVAAKDWIETQAKTIAGLDSYLEAWGAWQPWI